MKIDLDARVKAYAAMTAAAVAALRQCGGGRYHVRRGPVIWNAWDFDRRPFGATFYVMSAALFSASGTRPGQSPPRDATVRVEIATAYAEPPDAAAALDPGEFDQLARHAREALWLMSRCSDAYGDAAVFAVKLGDATLQEMQDPDRTIVGVRVEFPVAY